MLNSSIKIVILKLAGLRTSGIIAMTFRVKLFHAPCSPANALCTHITTWNAIYVIKSYSCRVDTTQSAIYSLVIIFVSIVLKQIVVVV